MVSRDAATLRKQLQRLAGFGQTEEDVFNVLLTLLNISYAPDGEENGVWMQELEPLYWALDDGLVEAAVRLLRVQPIDDALDIASELQEEQDLRHDREVPEFAERSIQFLSEISRRQTARMLACKVLASSPLPPELVMMVGNAISGSPSLTDGAFLERWSVPRPAFDRCTRPRATERMAKDFGCGRLTCPSMTWAVWLADEHRWLTLHGKSKVARFTLTVPGTPADEDDRVVECRHASCPGHHDADVKPEDDRDVSLYLIPNAIDRWWASVMVG